MCLFDVCGFRLQEPRPINFAVLTLQQPFLLAMQVVDCCLQCNAFSLTFSKLTYNFHLCTQTSIFLRLPSFDALSLSYNLKPW